TCCSGGMEISGYSGCRVVELRPLRDERRSGAREMRRVARCSRKGPMQAAAVHPPALELLRAFGNRPRLAKRGEVLIRVGETAADLLLLASGWACRERLRPNGDQAVLDLYLPGDLIGLDNLVDEEAVDSIVALTAAGYYTLKRKAFELLLVHHPGVGLHVVQRAVKERRRLDEQRLELAGLNAVQRTAAFLLHICERLQKQDMNM